MDVPAGWVRVIRGPRPPSKPTPPMSATRAPQEFEPSVPVADAIGEVKKVEAAIAAGADSFHAQGLQEALRIARNKSRLPSVSERVESCKKFLERRTSSTRPPPRKQFTRQRLPRGERRLAQLQAEASMPVGEVLPQVSALQGQIDAGRAETAERRSKWMGTGAPLCQSNSTHAHRSSGVGGVVKRQELRSEECNRVRAVEEASGAALTLQSRLESGVASEEFEWGQPRSTVCGPADFRTLSRRSRPVWKPI